MTPSTATQRYQSPLVRGASIKAVGLLGKLLAPLLLVIVTWCFGPSVTGVFLLVHFIGDIARSLVVDGYGDAVTVFGSRAIGQDPDGDEHPETLYQNVGAALGTTVGISTLLAIVLIAAGPTVAAGLFTEQTGMGEALQLLGLSLPFAAFTSIGTAATKARFFMQYDVLILNFGKPVGLLASALISRTMGAGLTGLMIGMVATEAALSLVTLGAVARHFSVRRILSHCFTLRSATGLHWFAFPQNLNLAFNRYLTRLDSIALGILGFSSELIAFYSSAALITSSLREVKLIFSSAMAPVAARVHAQADVEGLIQLLGRVSRWIITLAAPLFIAVIVWRQDLLLLFDKSYTHDTSFMLLLLVPPFLSCAFGLAGNYIVYTGHSTFNLINSIAVAVINTGLNFLLIPRFGLVGAALATAIAATCISSAQMIELRLLEGVSFRIADIYKPHIGLAVGVAVLFLLGDPVHAAGGAQHFVSWLFAIIALAVSLWLLRHEELHALLGRVRLRQPRLP